MESLSLQAQADMTRREAEQGSLSGFRWYHQRGDKFREASELYALAGLMEQAHEASWDAQLWYTATAALGMYDKDERYFRPLATLVAASDETAQPETAGQEQRVMHVGDPNDIADDARSYYDRRLDEPNLPALIKARYADFLFDQGYKEQKAPRSRFEYARHAVAAYLQAAQDVFDDPDFTLEASIYLLRAAFIARSMNSVNDLMPRVRVVVVASLNTLREEQRYRYTIELTRALLTLGSAVEPADIQLAEEALGEGAVTERKAGRYFAERAFLAALEQLYDFANDAAGRDRVREATAAAYESEAAVRADSSHLAAAGLLEDAARVYQSLQMREKRDEILRQIKREYQAGEGEYRRIEVQGELPSAEIDELYNTLLAPLPIDDALRVLGAHPAFQPRYQQAVELAQTVLDTSPLLGVIPPRIIRDDSPTRRVHDREELFQSLVLRQFVHIINVTGIVVGVLMERLERDKGLHADVLSAYFEAWSLMDAQHIPFLRCGFERYYAGDYISALHILTPQIEGMLRSLLWQGGLTVTGLNRDSTGIDADTLSGLLRREDVQELLTEDLWRYLDTTLSSSQGLNLRNDIAHGLIKPAQIQKVTCVIVIHLLLSLTRFYAGPPDDDATIEPDTTEESGNGTITP